MDDDSLYLEAIAEHNQLISVGSFQRLLKYQINPFELNEDDSHLPMFDTDPDLQYFNDTTTINTVMKCDYYLEETFIRKCHETNFKNHLSMIHLNIRSVPKNISSFKSYLSVLYFNDWTYRKLVDL